MRKTIVECDAPSCARVETIPAPSVREVPDGWISLKVETPKRSWPFGTQNRTFCGWECVSNWAMVLAGSNGQGPGRERPAQTGEMTAQVPPPGPWETGRG